MFTSSCEFIILQIEETSRAGRGKKLSLDTEIDTRIGKGKTTNGTHLVAMVGVYSYVSIASIKNASYEINIS